MTKTEYLQLIKEGEDDFYSIDTVNRNLDKIDSMFGKLAWFCVCGSRKMDVNKIVDAEGFQLFSGVRAIVYFTWGNTAENITMNINGTGAYPVKYKNEPLPAGFIQAEWALEVVYHAGCWRVVGDLADKRAQELAERIDGMTPSDIGALPVSGNAVSASKWNTARKINGMSIDGTADRTNYGVCSTSGSTAAKTVSCAGFNLATGAEITVKFNNTNTSTNPTLNVNGTGAKAIYYKGVTVPSGYIVANGMYTFRYNGTQWEYVGDNTQKQVDDMTTRLNNLKASDIDALPVSGNAVSASKWNTTRKINGMSIDGTADRTNYGVCSTEGSVALKTVSCPGFSLVMGAEITVKFNNTNTALNPTLNVNSTGAKAIYYKGAAVPSGYIASNGTYTFRYTGMQWEVVGEITNKQVEVLDAKIFNLQTEIQKLGKEIFDFKEITSAIFERIELECTNGMLWEYRTVDLIPKIASPINGAKCVAVQLEKGVLYKVVTSILESYTYSFFAIMEVIGSDNFGDNGCKKLGSGGKESFIIKPKESSTYLLINCCDPDTDIEVYKLKF